MSLQRRLTLFSTLVVILPLAVAGFIVQRAMVAEIERRTELSLSPALGAAEVVLDDRSDAVQQHVTAAADSTRLGGLLTRGTTAAIRRYLVRRLSPQGLDFLVALDGRGTVMAAAVERPEAAGGSPRPTLRDAASASSGVGPGFVRSRPVAIAQSRTESSAALVGGFWIDEDALVGEVRGLVELAVVVDGHVVASTAPVADRVTVPARPGRSFDVESDGRAPAEAAKVGPRTWLVAWAPVSAVEALADRVGGSLAVLLVLALVAIAVLSHLMAKVITRPLQELSAGAQAIAEGRFDHRIDVRSTGELGSLAAAFNDMSDRLNTTITELSSSRAQLQRAVQRAAKTFRSTHNMDQIMESLLDTAIDAVRADAAILWRFAPTRRELYPAITRGVEATTDVVPVGTGIAGLVAERGTPMLRGPDDEDDLRATVTDFPVSVAAPLYSRDRVQGVIHLLRKDARSAFGRQDLSTVVFLAEQGGVAIENVMLHEEARRLSLSDGLTGVWNRRYFQMQFRQVLATSLRFRRPFSVLMMDLDRFKEVNDSFGHQRGDATLVEFARRVSSVLREVDTFARYGGEEFICLLSETDYPGALTTAGKVLDVIKAEPFGDTGEKPVRLTLSIGIASYPVHGSSFTALVEAADQALYRAKEEGRDRAVVAGDRPPNLTIAR